MNKIRLVLELMAHLKVNLRDLMEASSCMRDGKMSLKIYFNDELQTDDLEFIKNNPRLKPKGVIIDNTLYPFRTTYCDLGPFRLTGDIAFKKGETKLPTEAELQKLAEHYAEYYAIAAFFECETFSKAAVEHPRNSDDPYFMYYYKFADKSISGHNSSVPYMVLTKL